MANIPDNLEVSDALVVVEWVDADGRKQYLPDSCTGPSARSRGEVYFDLVFDASSNSSFCRLHAPFVTTHRPKEVLSISLHIPPERVTTIDAERPGNDLPEDVSRHLGKELVRLRFNMKNPADLVVPQGSLVPKSKTYRDNLDIMTSLARSNTITFYLACLTEEQLRPLCNAITRGGVRSIGKYADLTSMYFGRGGRIYTDSDTSPTQANPPDASESEQAGPSRVRQQSGTSGPSKESLPPYPAWQVSSPSYQHDPPQKRRRPSSTTDVEENYISVLRRLVVEMYGSLGQEVCAIQEELRVTRQELHEVKEELHTTKQELCDIREELQVTDEDLAADELDVYTKDEMDERLHDVQERCEGLINLAMDDLADKALDELDLYTKDEVDERLNQMQDHCEGLNNLETEEMVLGAKSDLEKEVRNEIKHAKLDLRQWFQAGVRLRMRKMATMEHKFQAAEGRVMEAVHMAMRQVMRRRRSLNRYGPAVFGRKFHHQLGSALVRVQALRSPPRIESGTSTASTASTASAASSPSAHD
ncbi:hypothetical protein VM1G_09858 [Cytospora mali]|uniref:Uncharacterized protein n=1 Tax=Cytospora mali TaxID=578113 RepID=A0A194WCI3_CYTMA|nr:hypothetical protein VM1G_09858 [Valsa mali]